MRKKQIPNFENLDQEKDFWLKNDSCNYIDWGNAQEVSMPNLKPSTKTISIRLSQSLLNELKILANKKDVPYQSLIKVFLSEKINEERQKKALKNRKNVTECKKL